MDAELEKAEGMSIKDIFAQKGEPYFRERESAFLRNRANLQYTEQNAAIVSTGGGVVLREGNVKAMRDEGLVIFIDRPLDSLEASVKPQAERPLVQAKEDLEKLYRERIGLYRKAAHCVIDNSGTFEDALADLEAAIGLSGVLGRYMVIGDPISHSLSPALHEAAFEKLSQSAKGTECYIPVRVRAAFLPQALAAFRAGTARGMNVTIPHKVAAGKLVDKVEGDAVDAKAINTIVRRSGKLYGYNTDMGGLEAALARHGRYYKDSNIVISGAGGAAAGIIAKAKACGAKSITVICRNGEKGRKLVSALGVNAEVIEHDFSSPPHFLSVLTHCDLFINATPLGMSGTTSDYADLSFVSSLPKTCFVSDLVYKPPETRLLKQAKVAGLASCNGLDMLVFQAILADELFLGIKADRNNLYRYIIGKLHNGNGKISPLGA
jgi:shikimate dehydrogenase